MKKLLLTALTCLLAIAAVWSQAATLKPGEKISVVVRMPGMPANVDSFSVYEPLGLANKYIGRAVRRLPDSAYVFNTVASAPRFIALGPSESQLTRVIVGQEKEVLVWGSFIFFDKARTVNSQANKQWEQLRKRIASFQAETDVIRLAVSSSQGNGDAIKQAQKFNQRKTDLLDSLKSTNPLLWRTAALMLPAEYAAQNGYASVQDFIGRAYFDQADLSNPVYETIPYVADAFDNYARAMMNTNLSRDKILQYAETMLKRFPEGSKARRMAMGGLISAFQAMSHPLYPDYAKKYFEMYGNDNWGEIPRLKADISRAQVSLIGGEAPELEGMTPDSNRYALSKLRGKVVMVDFWASWCGPCRKENPNVVANYQKYKDKGFDILGVSLDREINAWRNAIKQDGLPWHHISDLKGWQSSHAALYSITSIPQTLLLDREGRIIARNLRGEQLGEKLKEIFGE